MAASASVPKYTTNIGITCPPEQDFPGTGSVTVEAYFIKYNYIFFFTGNLYLWWFLIFAGFEIYLCDADPMVSPALYNSRNTGLLLDKSEDKEETKNRPDFVHSQGDFPQLGEKPVGKDGHTAIVRFFCSCYRKRFRKQYNEISSKGRLLFKLNDRKATSYQNFSFTRLSWRKYSVNPPKIFSKPKPSTFSSHVVSFPSFQCSEVVRCRKSKIIHPQVEGSDSVW